METELPSNEINNSENDDFKQEEGARPKNKKFTCSFCSKVLSSKQNLKEHEFTHTGELPYVCKYPGCGMRFRQGSVLSSHKRIHSFIEKYIGQDTFSVIRLTDLLKKFREKDLDIKTESKEKVELPPISGPQEFFICREYDD